MPDEIRFSRKMNSDGKTLSFKTDRVCSFDQKDCDTIEQSINFQNAPRPLYKGFSANTFEELDAMVHAFLEDGPKRLITITSYFDGKMHHTQLAASVMESAEVLINGTTYRCKNAAAVNKDSQMMVQCYLMKVLLSMLNL